MSIKVSIVEDNESIRQNLGEILDSSEGFRLGRVCASSEEALRLLPTDPPDVVLMDIRLPKLSGIDCVRELKRCLPATQFVMVTVDDESESVFDALKAGATGYLVKNEPTENILAAIVEVHRGGSPMSSPIARMLVRTFQSDTSPEPKVTTLTPREQEILRLLTRGYRSKEVAEELGIGVQTVQTHLRNIYEKLHVRSRAEAVARYVRSERGSADPAGSTAPL